MSDAGALARVLCALIAPRHHGQHCPVWTRRTEGAKSDACDCWQIEIARVRADTWIADPGPLLAALAEAGVLREEKRHLDDGMAGASTDRLTGEVRVFGRRATHQRRYASRWEATDA